MRGFFVYSMCTVVHLLVDYDSRSCDGGGICVLRCSRDGNYILYGCSYEQSMYIGLRVLLYHPRDRSKFCHPCKLLPPQNHSIPILPGPRIRNQVDRDPDGHKQGLGILQLALAACQTTWPPHIQNHPTLAWKELEAI